LEFVFGQKTIPQGASTYIYACLAPELELDSGAYLSCCSLSCSSPESLNPELRDKLYAETITNINVKLLMMQN